MDSGCLVVGFEICGPHKGFGTGRSLGYDYTSFEGYTFASFFSYAPGFSCGVDAGRGLYGYCVVSTQGYGSWYFD